MRIDKMKTKYCRKCDTVKSIEEFTKSKAKKDGLQSNCKACRRAYLDANKERIAAQRKGYYEANKASKSAYMREYRKTSKERMAAYLREYKRANKEKVQIQRNRYRARKVDAPGTHTAEQWQARLAYFGHKCRYCGSTEELHCDHQIPLSRGGSNWPANLAPACKSCNCSKGTKTHLEFLSRLSLPDEVE